MNLRRNRESGGNDPFDERPNLTPEEAARAAYGAFSQVDLRRPRELPIRVEDVIEDPAIQVRIGTLRADVVENYAAVLLNGGRFEDSPDVFTDQLGADGVTFGPPYILADGFHRRAAHRLAYETTGDEHYLVMRARVHYSPEAWEDARAFAETANLTHGLQLTNKEKQQVLARRVLRGHEWYTLSRSALAKELGVARQTVQNWLLELARKHPDNEYVRHAAFTEAVVGADGRVYGTGVIREEAEKRGYSRPQKTARAAAQNVLDALERLERLEYPMDHPLFQEMRELVEALKREFEIDDL